MSNRLGGFIAGQNINVAFSTFTAVTSPTFTFPTNTATPAVGQAVQFTTIGTLPTGLSTNTTYYVISTSTNTCQFSTTLGGSAVTFTNSSGSGTHTAVTQRAFNPYAGAPDTVEYLVVAGGGSGGAGNGGGGGGGAGGLLTATGFSVATGSALIVTIGAGGAGLSSGNFGTPGNNSVFSSITSTGGGRGAYFNTDPAGSYNGGSGGGGNSQGLGGSGGGTGISGQGFAGGAGTVFSQGGGGGGAGSVGTASATSISGNGGAGLCSTITGSRVFYAGGGGGGASAGLGCAGGGNGGNNTVGENATANTGGGGGGGGNSSVAGGSGGSGIVIVRYPQINSAPALVTGSPQVNYADGYQIYSFTSSGSIIF